MKQQPGRERGATTAELAVVMPVLLLMVFMGVHAAVWLHATQIARAAAQEGARAARVENATAQDGESRAESFLQQLGGAALTNATVTATRDARTATVEVRGRSMAVVPFWHLPVTGRSSGPVERFRNPGERP